MAIQLGFDLPVRTARGRDDFLVAPCNAMAVAMIENWQNWPGSKMVLTGPEGAGKTHLTHVWADAAQAQIISASALVAADVIPYLLLRMDRSFAAANRIVESLDRESLARKRPVTRALAALVLDKLETDAR